MQLHWNTACKSPSLTFITSCVPRRRAQMWLLKALGSTGPTVTTYHTQGIGDARPIPRCLCSVAHGNHIQGSWPFSSPPCGKILVPVCIKWKWLCQWRLKRRARIGNTPATLTSLIITAQPTKGDCVCTFMLGSGAHVCAGACVGEYMWRSEVNLKDTKQAKLFVRKALYWLSHFLSP